MNRKQKLRNLLEWVSDVFSDGMSMDQEVEMYEYSNKIRNTMFMTREFYRNYKRKLLSLAVAVEYHDDKDTTGERKTKIYTCYKNNGNVPNDLLVLIEYVLRFFSTSVNVQEIRERKITENERIMNYEKYFKLKRTIIRKASSSQENLYTVIAQRYENLQHETQEQIQRALAIVTRNAQRQRQNNIATRQLQIEQGIISH